MMSIEKQQIVIDRLLFPYAMEYPTSTRRLKATFKDIDLFDSKYKYMKKNYVEVKHVEKVVDLKYQKCGIKIII